MNTTKLGANSVGARLAALLGSASLLTLASAAVYAQEQQVAQAQVAQAEEIPETVLITGSLIRGTAAVGVPVINLAPRDFAETGALTVTDLLRTVPAAVVQAGALASSNAGNSERSVRVNLRGLDSPTGARSLFMVDTARVPLMSSSVCIIDPSIIPALAIDRIDVLVDGASATYGSDAIAGVLNIILKRNYDGATTQLRFTAAAGGGRRYQASALWGRTWDGGGVTITYEWHEDTPMMGNFHSQHTVDHTPWGLDNRFPLATSIPGTISTGVPRADPTVNHGITSAAFGLNCTNCYAIPLGTGVNWDAGATGIGPTAPSSGATLTWNGSNFVSLSNGEAAGSGTNGTRNVTNPYHLAWYSVAEQANRAVITVDQRLTRNISFYGDGYYSNRRSLWLTPPVGTMFTENAIFTMPVPTFNPYYPVGAPSGLQVSYTTIIERPTWHPSYQLDGRYLFGLNFALPASWAGKAFWSYTFTQGHQQIINAAPNKNAISAALGWTLNPVPGTGSTPTIATWAKPANVPYLNLFCDPTALVCNAPETLDFIMGYRDITSKFVVNEKAVTVDGPLFDLPAGVVKAAVGATYTTYSFGIRNIDTRNSATQIPMLNVAPDHLAFWAVFTQVNVPLIGEANSLPFVRRLELEASWRHDQYDQGIGGTSNAKAAFNWGVTDDFTIRGAWGESFRAPGFGETSDVVGFAIFGWNLPTNIAPPQATLRISCNPAGVPNAGSGAAKVFDPAVPGLACGSAPPGVSVGGGNKGARSLGLRDVVNTEQYDLEPEKGTNWSLGFDYSPTTILQGLNLQATWYRLKVSGPLDSGFLLNPGHFNNPENGFKYIVPSDLGCSVAANSAPTTCAPFQAQVARVLANPRSAPSPAAQTLVYWISDNAGTNGGWEELEGIDWTASYDWEWPSLGAFNVGITGTYYLSRAAVARPGGTAEDAQDPLHTTISVSGIPDAVGVPNQPQMRYRARVGWANGTWSVTGFFNYRTHFWTNAAAPPNVNNQCQAPGGTIGGGGVDVDGTGPLAPLPGPYPCAISDYRNQFPPIHTFDLSIGYDTGSTPANEYLRNIGVQIVVQNLFDRHPPYAYITGARPGAWATGAQGGANEVGAIGRTMSLIVTKTW